MLILGALAVSIIVFVIIITILLQCGSKDKDKSTLDNGKVVANEQYKQIDDSLESGKDQEQHIDCKIDVETSEKSASLKPDKLVRETKVGKQWPGSPDASNNDAKEIAIKTQDENQVPLAGEQVTSDDSKPHEHELEDEGSFENSGSGDGIYTKVKAVEKKEECAYSIVNIANRDAEYEMVDGKLQRKPGEKKEKANESGYEVCDSSTKQKLDPVLFAVEDSGASGIYEDVPDRKASLPIGDSQAPLSDEQELKSPEVHEEHKKKWGITRFSLIKRNKSKQHQDSVKNDKQSLSSCPTTPEKLEPNGTGENLNISHGKSDNLFHRPKTDHVGLPPLPPLENRKLKEEHRRTYHESQIEGRESLEKMRTLSGTELGTLATTTDYDDYDDMYEVPDRDNSMVKHKTVPGSPVGKLPPPRQGSSPMIQRRTIPKPPVKVVVTDDDMDGGVNNTYDTISCSLALDGEDLSEKQDYSDEVTHKKLEDDNPKTEPEYAVVDKQQKQENKTKPVSEKQDYSDEVTHKKLEDDNPKTEPEYAVVDKQQKQENKTGPASSVSYEEKNQSPTEEKKIEIFIRRTTISSKSRGVVCAQETRKEVEVVERPPSKILGSIEPNQLQHDSVQTPAALDDLYAKVNLEEKHLEESKKALYATVDKPKTGQIKVYRSVSVEDDNEFEGGHYTRIKGDDNSATSYQSQQKYNPSASSDYETVGEQELGAIFASMGPQKRAEIADGPATNKPNKIQSGQGNADYKVIPQREMNGARSKTSKTNEDENDYEEITTVKRTTKRSSRTPNDYMDIGDVAGQDFKF